MSLYLDRTTGESAIDEEPITQAELDCAIAKIIERDRPTPGEMLDYFPEVVDRGMKLGAMFRLAVICALENPTPANVQSVGHLALRCIRAAQREEAESLILEERHE